MEINAAQVKELREMTGIGMMQCKKALADTNGDMEKAVDMLRKLGEATATKRAGKAAKEGKISVISDATCAILYEVNSETDFVARNDDFLEFTASLGKVLLAKQPATVDEAKAIVAPEFGGVSADDKVMALITKIGEKIAFRRFHTEKFAADSQRVFSYIHGVGRIGVLVKVSASTPAALTSPELAELGKDLAMQIAASNPVAVNRENVNQEIVAKEKEIYLSQAQTSGKPAAVVEKITLGKLDKFFKEMVLIEQIYIKNNEIAVSGRIEEVEKALSTKIGVVSFVRFELGSEA